jgi:signal transduction histidine kinase
LSARSDADSHNAGVGEDEKTDRLHRLQSLTDAALAHLQLEELLAALLERTRDLLAVDTCAVLLLDEEANDLVARAAVGIEEEVERGVRIPVGRGFAGRVAAERRPVVLDDVVHADVLNPLLREKGIKSMLGVPLIVEGDVVGVMHVGSLTPRLFRADDIELLQLVGDRAALAIDHARAFGAERAARIRLEHVQAITDAALAHLELDDLFRVLLPRIGEILRTDTVAVLLLDRDTDELVARAAVGIEEEVERGVRIPLGRGFAGRVAAQQRPVILDDVDHADVLNPLLREKGIKSLLGVPLVVTGDVIGVLHVGSLTPRDFTRDDTELLQLVAERFALAIERARLHEETLALDQLKLNFVAIASHELRTPATSVYGVFATLDERWDTLDDATRRTLVRSGHEQGARLRRLIEELLDLSRLDASSIKLEPRPLVVREALAEIAAAALPEGTVVELDVAADLAAVADPLVLDRVVSNLLGNAVRYGQPPFVMSAERRDRHLRIVVEDAGAGVDPELLPRLFERFARGETALGSGLGLAIARAYARAHGGDLLYSRGEGGARFELVVPQ